MERNPHIVRFSDKTIQVLTLGFMERAAHPQG
jgi:hypothetical protein